MPASPTTPRPRKFISAFRPAKHDPSDSDLYTNPLPIEDQRWDFSYGAQRAVRHFSSARVNGTCLRGPFAALLVARQLSEATGEPVTGR